MILNTSLLRERFVIHDTKNPTESIIAVGNRMLLSLSNNDKSIQERFVVRAQSMHVTLRLIALITAEFHNRGPILNRTIPMKWQHLWNDATIDYEKLNNPHLWGCIYQNGKPIFRSGKYHPFLDVIEQCDVKNRAEYDRAILIAEDAFKTAGKTVRIDHDVNIGVVIGTMENSTRCGLILRAPTHTSTFNFTITENPEIGMKLSPEHGLDIAACFLEGIQLAYATGMAGPDEAPIDSQTINGSAKNRIGRLNHIIESYERDYKIRYRPERPEFTDIVRKARSIGKNKTGRF